MSQVPHQPILFNPQNSCPLSGSIFSYSSSLNRGSGKGSDHANVHGRIKKLASSAKEQGDPRRQSSAPKNEMLEKGKMVVMNITARSAGALIGKGGAKVSEIRQETGVKIHLRPLGVNPYVRQVALNGATLDAITLAMTKINLTCDEEEKRLEAIDRLEASTSEPFQNK
jgi:hypothetical protein